MAPEYGATMGFFPVDEKSLDYLALTDRKDLVELVETYTRTVGLFYTGTETPVYTKTLEIDLGAIQPSLAGPSRPQDRVLLRDIKPSFAASLKKLAPGENETGKKIVVELDGETFPLTHGSVVIAAITSCTNTSNPRVLVGAGLLAKKAVEKGLHIKKYVKTSFAPGSRAVAGYMEKTGLLSYLDELGFNIVAYGCTTCIGNSGPLRPEIEKAIMDNNLAAVAVLSGNRNFEARVHQQVKANYLASPLLVVAFALAGRIDIDMNSEPLGIGKDGKPVFLEDIWPDPQEIYALVNSVVTPGIYSEPYRHILDGDENWQSLPAPRGSTFKWDEKSTYIRRAPFFDDFKPEIPGPEDIRDARALLALGDSVTTDHISPAGEIAEEYPAGQYLISKNVKPGEFNSYGSRRGNHEVMIRGTFANIRIKNKLAAPREGGYTVTFPGKTVKFIYEAAQEYIEKKVPLIIIGGKEYGSGSSRDWAAKGTLLLGVRAVIAQSFERIHRSNLIGMGVLPLEFEKNTTPEVLGLKGFETFTIEGIASLYPGKHLTVTAKSEDGHTTTFTVTARLDTDIEVEYYKNNGILPYALRTMTL
jgi:aconitate hydratase